MQRSIVLPNVYTWLASQTPCHLEVSVLLFSWAFSSSSWCREWHDNAAVPGHWSVQRGLRPCSEPWNPSLEVRHTPRLFCVSSRWRQLWMTGIARSADTNYHFNLTFSHTSIFVVSLDAISEVWRGQSHASLPHFAHLSLWDFKSQLYSSHPVSYKFSPSPSPKSQPTWIRRGFLERDSLVDPSNCNSLRLIISSFAALLLL